MRILVCGDRNWTDYELLERELDAFHAQHGITGVVEGEARGADKLGALWALRKGIPVESFPAQWALYGKAAGPLRNQAMLDVGPEYVIAFHDSIGLSRGTADMLRRAKAKGIPTKLVTH